MHCDTTSRYLQYIGTPYERLVGQRLDAESNLCPISVQTLSKDRPIKHEVQVLSTLCPNRYRVCTAAVQRGVAWTEIGHDNPEFVVRLSKPKCSEAKIPQSGHTLDNHWT